jgi:hypothetical protein
MEIVLVLEDLDAIVGLFHFPSPIDKMNETPDQATNPPIE